MKSIRSSREKPLQIVLKDFAARVERERLRRRVPLAGHVALLDRPLFDRPDRLSGHAIEDEEERLLGRLRQRLDRLAVDGDVREDRRARDVVVPDPVVHRLIVPLPLTGLQIDRDDALAEQVVAVPMTADSSRRSALRPADRPSPVPRRPRSAPRRRCCRCTTTNRSSQVSLPNSPGRGIVWKIHIRLPTPDVESADVALVVALAARHAAGQVRGADDDRVAGDDRRGVQADLAGDEVHDLIVVLLQIDDAALAEARDRNAGLRVERDRADSRA